MAYDVNELRQLTTQVQPIKDKIKMGQLDLTQDEIHTVTRAIDCWKQYLETM